MALSRRSPRFILCVLSINNGRCRKSPTHNRVGADLGLALAAK
jgi:hypothetical protein